MKVIHRKLFCSHFKIKSEENTYFFRKIPTNQSQIKKISGLQASKSEGGIANREVGVIHDMVSESLDSLFFGPNYCVDTLFKSGDREDSIVFQGLHLQLNT